jgi:hypothetical protein
VCAKISLPVFYRKVDYKGGDEVNKKGFSAIQHCEMLMRIRQAPFPHPDIFSGASFVYQLGRGHLPAT